MRTILTLALCIAIPTAAAQTINRCTVKGKVVFTDQPCSQAMDRPIAYGTSSTNATGQISDQELARQHDERVAQRDRDQATERIAAQSQVDTKNGECARMRTDRDQILRLPIPQQRTEPWRGQMEFIRARMSYLHC